VKVYTKAEQVIFRFEIWAEIEASII